MLILVVLENKMGHTFSKISVIVLAAILLTTAFLFPAAASGSKLPAAAQSGTVETSSAASGSRTESATSASSAASSEIVSEVSSEVSEASSSAPASSKSSSKVSLSSNNLLKSLWVSYHTLGPDFDPYNQTYGVLVAYSVTNITVHATPQSSHATVSISGNYDLDVGLNVITIKVTAQNGDVRRYYIKATREDQNGGVIDSAALAAYFKSLESGASPASAVSGKTSSPSSSGGSLPMGMRLLIAAAVVSGTALAVSAVLIARHKRRLKAKAAKKAKQPQRFQ